MSEEPNVEPEEGGRGLGKKVRGKMKESLVSLATSSYDARADDLEERAVRAMRRAIAEEGERIRELLDHCQLQWEDTCLDFDKRASNVATPSAVQVRQGIYTGSVNRWQRYGNTLQPLYNLLRSAGYYA